MEKRHSAFIITIAVIIGFLAVLISFDNEMFSTKNIDTDGDSYTDDVDAFPDDPTEWLDSDNDTYGDNSDVFPNNASEHLLIYLTIDPLLSNSYGNTKNLQKETEYKAKRFMP